MTDLLSIGRSGVLAYKGALQTTGENVTNADTDGYARRAVLLKEQTAISGPFALNRTGGAFGGVSAAGVARVWDQYKAASAWSANSDNNNASTRAQYLSTMESMLNDTDNGIGTRLTAIFTNAAQLAANPADTSQRQAFIGAVSDATTAINTTANNLAKLSGTISTQATITVGQVNAALTQLARINTALHTAPPATAARAQLEDTRDQLLGTVSGALSIDTDFAPDGAVAVRLNNPQGPLLLAGNSSIPSTVQIQTSLKGLITLSVQSSDVSGSAPGIPTGGSLAGLMASAVTNSGRRDQLDGLAASLAGTLNSFQAAGKTDDGTTAPGFLTANDPTAIDAASLRLDPALTPAGLALASADGKTANGNLLDLANQRGPGGVEQTWKSIVTDQALMVSSAKTEQAAASSRKDSAYTALDQTTGVDLDNEAAELLRFQQAYSASAKVIQASRQTLQDILNLF